MEMQTRQHSAEVGQAHPAAPARFDGKRTNAQRIEAVLFDVGDTLLHFETAEARRFLASAVSPAYDRLTALGLRLPAYAAYERAVIRAFRKAYVWSRIRRREVHLVSVYRRLHRRMGVHLDDGQLIDLAHRCTAPIRRFFTVDKEAKKVAGRLFSADFKLGLVSNTFFPGFAIDEVLRHEGLIDYFTVRIYSSDVGYMKPNPKIYRLASQRLSVPPQKTLFVGDRVDNDVKGPSRFGMRTAWLAHNGRSLVGRTRPDHVIARLSELPAILNA